MSEQTRPDEAGRRRGARRPVEGRISIDLGFGELFKGLGNVLDLVSQMAEQGQAEVHRSGEVQGPGAIRGVYGFTIKTGLGGTPTVESFGNVRATDRGPEVSSVREPLVDVFDEGDHVLVVVELPGVPAEGITLEVKDDILSLSAVGEHRKYAKEILLPAMVAPESLTQSYQSGILEVRLKKDVAR